VRRDREAIEGLRAAPAVWRVRGARGRSRSIRYGADRSNRESAEIAAALRARAFRARSSSPRSYQDPRAIELAACSRRSPPRAIARPACARCAPVLRRAVADLMQVVDAPDHHPQIAQIFDWAQLAQRRAYEALFRRVVEDSRFAERALVLGGASVP